MKESERRRRGGIHLLGRVRYLRQRLSDLKEFRRFDVNVEVNAGEEDDF